MSSGVCRDNPDGSILSLVGAFPPGSGLVTLRSSLDHTLRRDQTPVMAQRAAAREKVSVVAALSLAPHRQRLGLYFRTRARRYFDSQGIAELLRELLKHPRGNVLVMLDIGDMNKGEPIREVLAAFPRLSLERVPPYSPDLNPVEWVWSSLRCGEMADFAPRDAAHLDGVVTDHLPIREELRSRAPADAQDRDRRTTRLVMRSGKVGVTPHDDGDRRET